MEEWKTIIIDGINTNYMISNLGRVKSLKRNIILSTYINHSGYECARLMINGKRFGTGVHRLVAQAFIPNPNNWPQVNHKDENPLNNRVENLEWCTSQYNNTYGNRSEKCSYKMQGNDYALGFKHSDESKAKRSGGNNGNSTKVICLNYYKVYDSLIEASNELNCGRTYITNTCKGKQRFVRNRETKVKLYFMYYDDFIKICEENNKRR